MSEPLRIALVAEGPTDRVVVQAAIEAILPKQAFVLRQIQPEQSAAFGEIGTGWVGVWRWCQQAQARRTRGAGVDPIFASYDLLVIHLDADVANMCYADGQIQWQPDDLPCAKPCPPASATTNALRTVLTRWFSSDPLPGNVVLCTPSKSMDAWVLFTLFPQDGAVPGIECFANPVARLGVQPAKVRIKKSVRDYEFVRPKITAAWGRLVQALSEAARFQVEFNAAIAGVPLESDH